MLAAESPGRDEIGCRSCDDPPCGYTWGEELYGKDGGWSLPLLEFRLLSVSL